MNAEIIAVGSELLLGQIANTNAQFLSSKLAELGVPVYFHSVAGDNADRLKQVISTAVKRSDCIIVTGGLGPTKDDLTKETIADLFGRKLVYDQQSLTAITDYFSKTGREMSENNKKQALVIEGSSVLPNDFGMAPGMVFQANEAVCMLLPGPPKEMQPMFLTYGVPYFEGANHDLVPITSRVLRFFGIGESLLEAEIQDLLEKQSNPTIAPLAAEHEVTLRLTARFQNDSDAQEALDQTENKIRERVGHFLYGYGETTLADAAVIALKKAGKTIASAESLTGGWFGKSLTDVPGTSKIYAGGVIAYTNEVKERILGVSSQTIKNAGAVSAECAKEMADGVRQITGSDIGISFTGIAGPGESEGKEEGTVFIGLSSVNGTMAVPLKLAGNRESIRLKTVKNGLFQVIQWLEKGDYKKTE